MPSLSADCRDKVYALFGITSDITNESKPLILDYEKFPVQVLVDVIRNQCQWGAPDKGIQSLRYISLGKDTLGVSHPEAENHVIECAPDPHAHVHMIASTEVVYAPMNCVSTIIKVGFELTREGLTPKRNSQG